MEVNQIVCGDCQKVLGEVVDNSVDQIVTDPPYGYSFMGKDWDKAVPCVAIWKECLRVLKPGAFAFVMSSPRADVLSHMIVNLGDAGFRTDFTPIYWAYASGFPKAMNVSLQIDKQECMRQLIAKLGRKPIKDKDAKIDEFADAWKIYRNVTGESKPLEYAGKFDQRSSQDRPKDDGAVSIEAKLLDGSFGGFQPKPAVEVIIVAMKPLSEKTYVDQALMNQKGITWLGDCRIPVSPDDRHDYGLDGDEESPKALNVYSEQERVGYEQNEQGRFPANLLVSDDCLNDGQSWKGGQNSSQAMSIYGNDMQDRIQITRTSDEGSFSRYFSLDAWFQKQIKKLPVEVQRTFPFLIEPKASKAERNKNLTKLSSKEVERTNFNQPEFREQRGRVPKHTIEKNFHPTVKPLDLMSYLITLGSRQYDLILDPFCGSGTTCLAAKMLGRRFLGIEIKEEYVKLAETRVHSHKTLGEFEIMPFNSEKVEKEAV